MTSHKTKEEPLEKTKRESADESEEECETLEESPCGRWLKRREEIKQRNIPGIDVAYLAMDTEEGVEVVWNEVKFSERKSFKYQERKIRDVFDSLILLDHPNIVKFHKYWIDKDSEKLRVVFITEYMSSGSLKQFLKKTKRNVIKLPIYSWKRWCTQILSALNYLHSCNHPIVHGNLTCDTIFIQHNGLVKIGSVAPDVIHHNIKTYRRDLIHSHFLAPEYGGITFALAMPSVDIYAFGICALEMAALEICGNGDTGNHITEDIINKTIESLENVQQKDFIKKCLKKFSLERPTARELLFHPVIFEVHSLKLLAAHIIKSASSYQPDQLTNEAIRSRYNQSDILASVPLQGGQLGPIISSSDIPKLDLEKFLDDVGNGSYPLTAFGTVYTPLMNVKSPSASESMKSSPDIPEAETRRIVNIMCNIKPLEDNTKLTMTILLRMDDQMNRQLSCEICDTDMPLNLSEELVSFGFINEEDRDMVATLIGDTLSRRHVPSNI